MNLRTLMLFTLLASVTIGCLLLTFTGALIYEFRDAPAQLLKEARGKLSPGSSTDRAASKSRKTPQPVIVKNPYDTTSAP